MILTAKLVSKQGKGTVRWVEKWLDCRGQRLHQQHRVQLEAGYWCQSQGLKPALFKEFINDVDDRLECTLQVHGQKEIAVGQVFDILEVRMPSEGPQQAGERNRLKRNIMTFNKSKCEILHLGWNNLCSSTGWGQQDRKQLSRKRPEGSKSVVCPCGKEGQPHTEL